MLEFREIIKYIFLIGAAQAVLISVFLLNKKENRTANIVLGLTMVIFALDLTFGVIYLTGYISKIPWIVGLTNSFPYLYGPAIFLYTKLLTNNGIFKKSYFLHLLPFLIIQIYGALFFYFESPEYQMSLLRFDVVHPWHIQLISNLIPIQGIIYVYFTLRETNRFNHKLKNSFANIDKLSLSWLKFVVIGTFIIWLIVFLSYALSFIYGDQLEANILIYIGISLFLYLFGFKAYRQPEVIVLSETEDYAANEKEIASYKKSGLSDEAAEKYISDLMEIINSKKPYLNSKLNLSDLAEMVGISPHNLSEIINQKLNSNFYDFINQLRVEEVKEMITNSDYSNYSILAIGYEAGFSSKSAFYSAFKKAIGLTPAQYRKEKIAA